MTVPIKIGVVGYGGSAKIYNLPYILPNPDLEVYAFLQRAPAPSNAASPERESHCTVDFPKAKHYQTAEDFFADKDIELVVISTHPDTHAKFAEAALHSGKHVVVEKPFTRSSDEADRLIALAKEKSLILTCYQNRRWDGDFRTLRHLVEEKAFGTIYDATMHYDIDNPPWYKTSTEKAYIPGNGLMYGLGSHTMDQALLLFGRPKYITGFLQNFGNIGSESDDAFTIILTYDTPLVVTIKTTMHSPIENQLKYFVRGTSGSFLKFGTDIQEEHVFDGKSATDTGFGVADPSTHGLLTTHKEFDTKSQTFSEKCKAFVGYYPTFEGYNRGYYENIVDAIRGNAPLDVKPEDSRDGIRVFELARQSHVQKKTMPWS